MSCIHQNTFDRESFNTQNWILEIQACQNNLMEHIYKVMKKISLQRRFRRRRDKFAIVQRMPKFEYLCSNLCHVYVLL